MAAFEILRMFLRPFLIELRPSKQRPNSQQHYRCERSGVSLDFLIECDKWAMPRVAISQQNTPLLNIAFSKTHIYVDQPRLADSMGVAALSLKRSYEALKDWLMDRVQTYLNTLAPSFLSR